MSYSLVGKVWDTPGFARYVRTVDLSWAEGVTLHHTAAPSLAQRPAGFRIQHMRNLASYYGDKLGWSRGPHLFVDDDQVFGLSPLSEPGTHARSFNRSHIGIEVLGDYDAETPKAGRGLECWQTAARTSAALLARIPGGAWNFHRDDPKTNKSCPGRLVSHDWFASLLKALPDDDRADEPGGTIDRIELLKRVDSIEWQLKKLRELA